MEFNYQSQIIKDMEQLSIRPLNLKGIRGSLMILSVDFDGTLTYEKTYPDVGIIDLEMVDALIDLQKEGVILILDTCRNDKPLNDAVKALQSMGLTFDYVNENVNKSYGGFPTSTKVWADYRYDDSSFNWDRSEATAHMWQLLHDVRKQKQEG